MDELKENFFWSDAIMQKMNCKKLHKKKVLKLPKSTKTSPKAGLGDQKECCKFSGKEDV